MTAVDADAIAWTDDLGEIRVGSPDVEMSDTPTATARSGVVLVSTRQRNMFGKIRLVGEAQRRGRLLGAGVKHTRHKESSCSQTSF